MPDDDYEQDEESPVIRELRDKAKRTDDAEKDLADARKALAVHEAGFGHLNTSQRNALVNAVSGDPTPEALKAAATDLGFPAEPAPSTPPPAPEPQVSPEEQAAYQKAEEATAGAPASEAQGPLSQEDRIKAIRNQARTIEEADRLLDQEGIFLDSA